MRMLEYSTLESVPLSFLDFDSFANEFQCGWALRLPYTTKMISVVPKESEMPKKKSVPGSSVGTTVVGVKTRRLSRDLFMENHLGGHEQKRFWKFAVIASSVKQRKIHSGDENN